MWKPSPDLRALTMLSGIVKASIFYLVLRYCFPHMLLVPYIAATTTLLLAAIVVPMRVTLDSARGEVRLTIAWWTKHVRLGDVESVDQALRFGAYITTRRRISAHSADVGHGWSGG